MFHDTYLVQRLEKPRGYGKLGLMDNPFSFGGGLRDGGLNPEAMNLLRPIFGFDYMGAAEYEFGALPKALKALAEGELAFGSLEFREEDVVECRKVSKKREPLPLHYYTVYYLCPKRYQKEVVKRIYEDAKGKLDIKNGYKQFSQTLRMDEERWPDDTIGWFELDNGFFYFVDKEAAEKTAALFGVVVQS